MSLRHNQERDILHDGLTLCSERCLILSFNDSLKNGESAASRISRSVIIPFTLPINIRKSVYCNSFTIDGYNTINITAFQKQANFELIPASSTTGNLAMFLVSISFNA